MTKIILSELMLSSFKDILGRYAGLRVADRDQEKLYAAVLARMNALQLVDPVIYYNKLQVAKMSEEICNLACLLTNKESFFFRDVDQWTVIKNNILPEIIKNNPQREVKIWSAGCSTGEEPYTLAMILVSTLPDWRIWKINILGTDLCNNVLKQAREGYYDQMSFRSISSQYRDKFFKTKPDGKWQIDASIRNLVTFKQANLLSNFVDDQNFNLIICRNVFIYLQQEANTKIMSNFSDALVPGGYLVTGHGELQLLTPEQYSFKSILFQGSMVYQKVDQNGK